LDGACGRGEDTEAVGPGREAVDAAAQPTAAARAVHAAVAVRIRVVRGVVNVSAFLTLSVPL
jgi:hypothetical protein